MGPVERQEKEEGQTTAQTVEFLVVAIVVLLLIHRHGLFHSIEAHGTHKRQNPTKTKGNQRHEDAQCHQGDAQVGLDDADGAGQVAGRKGDLVLDTPCVTNQTSGHDQVQYAGGRSQR